MKKILITTSTFDLDNFIFKDKLEELGIEFSLNPFGKRLTEEQLISLIDDSVISIIAGLEPLTELVFKNAKSLKLIVRCGVGMDNVDFEAAERFNIKILNTPDAPTRAVAELTIGHILSLLRRISESDKMVKNNEWSPIMGRLLFKKTVGIIGFGRVGKLVSALLIPFGVNILVYDPYLENSINNSFVSLDELLINSDIVTLHVPYSKNIHHLIGARQLSLMKNDALLINIARGGLIDEQELVNSLNSGLIGGAALDCFEIEPYYGSLTNFKNVQITAHMGSYAKESRSMQEAESSEQLVFGLKLLDILPQNF